MQSIPTSTCLLTISAMAGVTCAAMTAGSVISALASRPGISSHPLGDGSRPTCEVLIRVMLVCMSPPPVPENGPAAQDHFSQRFNGEPPAGTAADQEVEPVRSRSSITPHPVVAPSLQQRDVAWLPRIGPAVTALDPGCRGWSAGARG